MKTIKRYWSFSGGDASMQETETGNFVKYEDYAALSEQVRLLTEQRDAVVAENVVLKAAFNPVEIPEEAVKAFTETAIMDHDWNESGEWSWVENDTDVIRAVLDAIKPETPATSSAIAALRAEGVEMFADDYLCPDIDADIRAFARQLRDGGNN